MVNCATNKTQQKWFSNPIPFIFNSPRKHLISIGKQSLKSSRNGKGGGGKNDGDVEIYVCFEALVSACKGGYGERVHPTELWHNQTVLGWWQRRETSYRKGNLIKIDFYILDTSASMVIFKLAQVKKNLSMIKCNTASILHSGETLWLWTSGAKLFRPPPVKLRPNHTRWYVLSEIEKGKGTFIKYCCHKQIIDKVMSQVDQTSPKFMWTNFSLKIWPTFSLDMLTKFQRRNLDSNVFKTILRINISNSNNINKF